MHRFFALISLVFFAATGLADDPATLRARADAALNAGEHAKAAELYAAAIEAGAPPRATAYNAACCHALLGDADEAFAWLGRSIEGGWRDIEHLKADSDLESLHDDPRWATTLAECQVKLDAWLTTLKEPELRAELLRRMREDQRVRTTTQPDFVEWQQVDKDNTAFMKRTIEKYGWPGKSMVGEDGVLAVFLMVQHADKDRAFQKRCLELLTKAVEQGEADASHMAYLTDRVLVGEGKSQRYGTQFHTVNGVLQPQAIEDEEHIDERRAEVGLPPLEEYKKQMEALQRP